MNLKRGLIMMKNIAVLFAEGFEESEALTIVDILRRAGMNAVVAGVSDSEIMGAHGVSIRADVLLSGLDPETTHMVVIPGGYGSVDRMLENKDAISFIAEMNDHGKWVAAICAGPRVLDKAGVLGGKSYTCYPGQETKISSGTFRETPVQKDGNVITAIGPAVCYAFAYALVDALGGDSLAVKNRMVYFNAFDESASHREACPDRAAAPVRSAKAAVLMKEGFEEGETFSIVDILRRTGVECTTFHFGQPWVRGMHGMMLQADRPFSDEIEDYDAVVLPGGRPGGQNLKEDPRVIDLLRRWNKTPGKLLGALCSGTTVLAAAEVIEGKHMTGYTGYAEKLPGAVFENRVAVADQNLVTSQGPATGYPFAFKLAEALGYDTRVVESRLYYDYAGGLK